MSSTFPTNGLANLSNDDVKLLYEIVTAAEASPAPPFRALFSAYEQTLAKYGIPKDSDQTYLRFLLRMGEGRKDGAGVFEQFESLLAKLGIHVAFDGEGGLENGENSSVADSDGFVDSPSIKRLQTQSFRPARRGSFDSALDAHSHTEKKFDRLQLLPPRSRSTGGLPGQGLAAETIHTPARQLGSSLKPAIHKKEKAPDPPAKDEKGSYRNNEPQPQPYRNRNDEGRGSAPLGETAFSSEDSGAEPDDDSELDDALGKDQRMRVSGIEARSADVPRQTAQQLDDRARTLNFHHEAAHAIRLFRHWRAFSEQSNKQHEAMRQTAKTKDQTALKRQALDQWRMRLGEKQKEHETEKFYHNLESRAEKARNSFLLSKAFTHWAQCTSEEVIRKEEARKNVLRTKYFSAWREVTIVNQTKARHLQLSKSLTSWKAQSGHLIDLDDQAIAFRDSRATKKAFRQWFWHFCACRAPQWHIFKVRRKIFAKWVESTRAANVRREWATDFRDLELQRVGLVQWTQRSNVVQQNVSHALDFRRKRLIVPTMEAFQRDLRLVPPQIEVRQLVDTRIVRSAFGIWLKKAQDILEARRIDKLRVTRNAWTQWNDLLRCRALSETINDRVVMEALYRWVLAERLALFRRIQQEKFLSAAFSRWVEKTNDLRVNLDRARYQEQKSKEQRMKASIMAKWVSMSEVGIQEDTQAVSFRDRKLASHSLQLWMTRYRQLGNMDRWAKEAHFYILTTSSIKTWQEKTLQSKKDKRREAYSIIRRKVKMSLARKVLERWREATQQRQAFRRLAENTYQQHIQHLLSEFTTYWKIRYADYREARSQADTIHDSRLAITCLNAVKERYAQTQDASFRAESFLNESLESRAKNCLRKLGWQIFQLRARQDSADRLAQRNGRNHRKLMLRHWADTAMVKKRSREGMTGQGGYQHNLHHPLLNSSKAYRQSTPFQHTRFSHSPALPLQSMENAKPVSLTRKPFKETPAYLQTPLRHPRPILPDNTIYKDAIEVPESGPLSLEVSNQASQRQYTNLKSNLPRSKARTPAAEIRLRALRESNAPSTPSPVTSTASRLLSSRSVFHSAQLRQRREHQLTPFMKRLRAGYDVNSSDHAADRIDSGTSSRLGRQLQAVYWEDEIMKSAEDILENESTIPNDVDRLDVSTSDDDNDLENNETGFELGG